MDTKIEDKEKLDFAKQVFNEYLHWYDQMIGETPSRSECFKHLRKALKSDQYSEEQINYVINLKHRNRRDEAPSEMGDVMPDNTPGPPRKYVPIEDNPMIEQLREDLEDLIKDIDLNYRRLNYRNTLVNKTLEVISVMLYQAIGLLDFTPECSSPPEDAQPLDSGVSGSTSKNYTGKLSTSKEGIQSDETS